MNLLNPLATQVCQFKPIYHKLKKLLGDISHLLTERNKAVHFVTVSTDDGIKTIRIKRTPELQRHKQFTAKQLEAIAERIKSATEELRSMELPVCDPMSPKILKGLAERYNWGSPSSDPKTSA